MQQITQKLRKIMVVSAAVVIGAVGFIAPTAQAYTPSPQTIYAMDGTSERCNKGGDYGGCIVYPKAAQTESGRIVMTFERSVGDPVGETLPIYSSDDEGVSWNKISEVKSPHDLEPSNSAYDKYVSNWTNPYLYTLPENVGDLQAGTLILASVVSGDDLYYKEQKAAQGDSWYNGADGDRENMAIALFSSVDDGVTWNMLSIVTEGGWQGGSARSGGQNISSENTTRQVDPVWEPYVMAYNGKLVCYYSDERDYDGYDTQTGVLELAQDDRSGPDNGGQILAHRTWTGKASDMWSNPVLDVSGLQFADGKIGAGRPGMTNVEPTTDGKWLLTYEDWGGNGSTKYKIADNPLEFYKERGQGTNTDNLPANGGGHLTQGGSPVLVRSFDGSLMYNASGSGDVWINKSGASDGKWLRFHTTLGGGYSRNLTPLQNSKRTLIFHTGFSGSEVQYADIDFGESSGDYYVVANKEFNGVIGTGGKIQDADATGDQPDISIEEFNSNETTQQWHLQSKSENAFTFLNRAGGRAIAPWGQGALEGKKMAQWVDEGTAKYEWIKEEVSSGYYRFRNVADDSLYLTAMSDGSLSMTTLKTIAHGDGNDATSGTQLWKLSLANEEPSQPSTVDKSILQSVIEEASSKAERNYTVESWSQFVEALKSARQIFVNDSVSQQVVDDAVTDLRAATAKLVPIDDSAGASDGDVPNPDGSTGKDTGREITDVNKPYNNGNNTSNDAKDHLASTGKPILLLLMITGIGTALSVVIIVARRRNLLR